MADNEILGKNIVYLQDWVESERGGDQRPDGYSVHLSEEERNLFVTHYWDDMPNETPHEYSRPSGRLRIAQVSGYLYKRVLDAKKRHGLMINDLSDIEKILA